MGSGIIGFKGSGFGGLGPRCKVSGVGLRVSLNPTPLSP